MRTIADKSAALKDRVGIEDGIGVWIVICDLRFQTLVWKRKLQIARLNPIPSSIPISILNQRHWANVREDDVIEVRAVFQGEVQGVGFRATARQHAMRLGLIGTVRNLPDGSVELCVAGNRPAIDSLLAYLKGPQGPGNVSKVMTEEISPLRPYKDFRIL